jgi:putative transposase
MNVLITAKLKLHTDAAQFQALRATSLAYRDALNHVSQYSFAHGKMSNQIRLRDATYYELRARYGLPAQMATNVPRQVGATYKTLWTKVKQNTDVSRDEAKAARFRRYAELRWSVDTSPAL